LVGQNKAATEAEFAALSVLKMISSQQVNVTRVEWRAMRLFILSFS
jgi:hypothetical protein